MVGAAVDPVKAKEFHIFFQSSNFGIDDTMKQAFNPDKTDLFWKSKPFKVVLF
jgi:hypothetical protein